MPYILEDGQGSRNKTAVFANKIRAFADEVSLMNHISSENETVFTIRSTTDSTIGTTNDAIDFVNTDPTLLIVVDRIYVQVFSSGVSLPTPNFNIAAYVINASAIAGNIPYIPVNENQSVTNPPNVSFGTSFTIFTRLNTVFPSLGDTIELIPQSSNGIILGFMNGIDISSFNATGTHVLYESFIQFAMVPPGNMG